MSTNLPIIKFSPFEALLIGEKNRILKRQPMKNTIFVSRQNRQCKTINLRVLFGLDQNEADTNDAIFKMPQRVQDFLNRKKKVTKENRGNNKQKEILCYEFEGQKINEAVNLKRKRARFRSNFKRKRKKTDKVKNKAVRKFPKPARNNYKTVLKKNWGEKFRGKPKTISPKQKHLANCMLHLKEDGRLLNNVRENEWLYEKPMGTVPSIKFDTAQDDDDLSKKSMSDFQKSKPKILNFDDDRNLLDIVYENFPKIVKFECGFHSNDFSEALKRAGLVKPGDDLECKKNGLVKNEFLEILSNPFPLVKCQRMNNINPNQCIVIGRCAEIDEAYLKKNHIMKSKNLESFFFKNGGKGVFKGNSLRPKGLVQNS